MTAHAGSYEKPPPGRRSLGHYILMVAFVVGVVTATIAVTPHAFERHGMAAYEAVECYNTRGPVMQLLNRKTNRTAAICQDDTQKYGWYIVIFCSVTGFLVTAFKRDRATCRNDCERYLRDSGFDKVL